jgi:hypothetical protein
MTGNIRPIFTGITAGGAVYRNQDFVDFFTGCHYPSVDNGVSRRFQEFTGTGEHNGQQFDSMSAGNPD